MFSDELPLAIEFASLLCGPGVDRGLIGPRESSRIWDRHLLNCAVASDAAGDGARVADVGSGAGLPGLVWAIRRPDLNMVLIEPLLRRASFLSEAVAMLGLDERVEVVRARAEDVEDAASFDLVTSRAVAPLKRLVPWCSRLCRQGGSVVAMKGRSVAGEVEAARQIIARVSSQGAVIRTYGGALVDEATTVVEIRVDRRNGVSR